MASKVKWEREAWWVFTHYEGKRRKKRVGSTKAHKREAEQIAKKINAALALGQFKPDSEERTPIAFGPHLRAWHSRYSVTFKPRYVETSLGLIDQHLEPFFGRLDLREIRGGHLLDYVKVKLDDDYAPSSILNGLSIVRRVLNLAVKDGLIDRNPALRVGELIGRVSRGKATQVAVVASWTREEAETLLGLAREHEPTFAPLLHFLLATGARRGEALGLRWEDVDIERRRITIRRALTKGHSVTPKSGKARVVAIPGGLAADLFDLFAERRRESLRRGWAEVPAPVFCSEVGTPLDERNVTRSWDRLRRRAQKHGVRPLRLHDARHTFASLALAAGRSIRWVAEQLGHANPELTLRVYAHALPIEESDLAFADFGGPGRPYTAPDSTDEIRDANSPGLSDRGRSGLLERETGIEPATLSLGSKGQVN